MTPIEYPPLYRPDRISPNLSLSYLGAASPPLRATNGMYISWYVPTVVNALPTPVMKSPTIIRAIELGSPIREEGPTKNVLSAIT